MTNAQEGARSALRAPALPRIPRQTVPVLEAAYVEPVVEERNRPLPETRPVTRRPAAVLLGEVLTVTVVGLLAGALVGAPVAMALGLVAATLLCRFRTGVAAVRPGLPHLREVVSAMSVPFATTALVVALTGLGGPHTLRDAAAMVVAMTLADVAAALLRRRVGGPVRVLLVGDRVSVSRAAARWAEDDQVSVVGGLLLEESAVGLSLGSTLGVRTISGIEEVLAWVHAWTADLVVVAPGSRVTSDSVRRLGWLLERGDTSLAVLGVLDSVAPHRIDSTVLGGATLVHARPSRPPLLSRGVKAAFDRVAAGVLLVVGAPVLVALWAWVRLDSSGPGLFRQVRVGQDGRLFRVIKLRTMVDGAEAQRAPLLATDEGHGALFKMRHDPRITRAGRFLRRTSLDELPQLWNVVRGEMSLVGPRPALPEEVATYDDLAGRRLAVRPGMTGLWQVSGRSDLPWDVSVELDVQYTDNHRFADDLAIGLRTVGAVTRARGAY